MNTHGPTNIGQLASRGTAETTVSGTSGWPDDPGRAAELVGAVAALRQAVVYDGFVQAIEPSERVYHAGDSARWLRTLASEAAVHS